MIPRSRSAYRNTIADISAATPLTIPTGRETVDGFITRLREMIASPKTHLYLDTSFLVWMTALGKEARGEFIGWIERVARGRVHVPVWSAHEYLRHHVQDLHGKTLGDIARDLNKVADDAFRTLRPYLDSQIADDPRPPPVVMSSARTSLIDIKRIANAVSKWRKNHYDVNAGEVIGLINRLGLRNPILLDWMTNIEASESARFEGRIPPGFQDRGKKANGNIGSNRFGDLIFWKEILQHAREARAAGIVILSNDGKNDWHMGGEGQPELDTELHQVRSGLPPLPRPHPMLQFEARGTAGIADLMLVDQAYFAIYLRRTGEPCDRFFGAAIEITLPTPKAEDKAQRAELRESGRPSHGRAGQERTAERAGPKHLPTEDGINVADTPIALRIALTASGRPADETMGAILESMLSPESEGKNLAEFFTATAMKSWDTRGVVWLARMLGLRSLDGDHLATTYATDVFSFLDRLPPRTATALYLGFMAAAYLDVERVRAIPGGPWLAQIFRLQSNPRAAVAINAFLKYISERNGRPVYLPDPAMPRLSVKPVIHTIKGSTPHLTGLQINDVGVIVEAQMDEDRRLANRFPGRSIVTVSDIVGEACAMLGIPRDQIEQSATLSREVGFGSTVGIASPVDLQSEMEDQA